MFSNKHFDPVAGSRLYNEYLEHYIYAEEQGVEGFMLNEHHNAPFCMQAKCNIFASILAAVTKKAKIVLLGNPLPLGREPGAARRRTGDDRHDLEGPPGLRLRPRRRPGAARRPASTRPTTASASRRRTIWSSRPGRAQGPFRWEGTHYQHRVVNPWAVPLQKPYPRVWIPGVLSQETIIWAAKQRYPYIALNTSIEATKKIWELYDKVALETGYEAGPENRGYLQQVHVSDSEEKAEKNARQFLWMQGEFTGLAHPVWSNPSGYFSPTLRRNFVEFAVGRAENPRGRPTFEQQVADGRVFFGTPKTVIPKLRRVLEETRPSIYGIWGNDGTVSNEDARTCIRLLGQEVMPAMREIGKELGPQRPVRD